MSKIDGEVLLGFGDFFEPGREDVRGQRHASMVCAVASREVGETSNSLQFGEPGGLRAA